MDDAGVTCDLQIEGAVRALPAGADLSAYRIVQEALTNVIRHSRAQHARVRVRFERAALELEIADDGPSRLEQPRGAQGRGLVGMRERAALCGGSLEAGPRAGGGFSVTATHPLGAET